MSTIEITCNCGWAIKANSYATVTAATREHDKTCPELLPDVIQGVTVRRPHSRACGIRKHDHGSECSSNCPTCGGL